MPVLPFCSITQTANAIALFIHRTHPDTGAVDDKHLKLRHGALGYAKLDIAFKIKIGYYNGDTPISHYTAKITIWQ